MVDINKAFKPEQVKKIVSQLTKSPTIVKGYVSALPRPHTPKTKVAQQEKTRE